MPIRKDKHSRRSGKGCVCMCGTVHNLEVSMTEDVHIMLRFHEQWAMCMFWGVCTGMVYLHTVFVIIWESGIQYTGCEGLSDAYIVGV